MLHGWLSLEPVGLTYLVYHQLTMQKVMCLCGHSTLIPQTCHSLIILPNLGYSLVELKHNECAIYIFSTCTEKIQV